MAHNASSLLEVLFDLPCDPTWCPINTTVKGNVLEGCAIHIGGVLLVAFVAHTIVRLIFGITVNATCAKASVHVPIAAVGHFVAAHWVVVLAVYILAWLAALVFITQLVRVTQAWGRFATAHRKHIFIGDILMSLAFWIGVAVFYKHWECTEEILGFPITPNVRIGIPDFLVLTALSWVGVWLVYRGVLALMGETTTTAGAASVPHEPCHHKT